MRKAIFWDFDGTLTTGEPTWRFCLVKALGPLAERYGVTEDKVRPYLKQGFPWHPDGDQTLTGEAFWDCLLSKFTQAYVSLGVPQPIAADAARRVRDIVQDPTQYRVRPDVPGVLTGCAFKGYKNYVLTNNFPEWENLLDKLNLRQYFDGVVVSGTLGLAKPDVRIFRKAEAVAHFPSLIWMVGDNPVADIQGARDAGWHTAYLAPRGAKNAGAEITFTSLSDLLNYL